MSVQKSSSYFQPTDQQTDIPITRAMCQAWLVKTNIIQFVVIRFSPRNQYQFYTLREPFLLKTSVCIYWALLKPVFISIGLYPPFTPINSIQSAARQKSKKSQIFYVKTDKACITLG